MMINIYVFIFVFKFLFIVVYVYSAAVEKIWAFKMKLIFHYPYAATLGHTFYCEIDITKAFNIK